MSQAIAPPIADGSIVRQVVLVDRIERPGTGRLEAASLPGHLVRVITSGRVKVESGGRLYECEPGLAAWRDDSEPPALRHMRVHARLLDLLLELLPFGGGEFRMDPATRLWWELEARIREDLSRPIDLPSIQKLTGRSLRTIIRSCHSAVGMPPMQRVKQMRLSMARGLVLYSRLTFSEIARRLNGPFYTANSYRQSNRSRGLSQFSRRG